MVSKNIKYTVFSFYFLLISNLASAQLEPVRGVWVNMTLINYLQKHNNQYTYEANKNIVINSLSFNQKTNTINISTFGSELFPYKYKYNSLTKEYIIEKIYLYDKFYDKNGKIIYGRCSIKFDNKNKFVKISYLNKEGINVEEVFTNMFNGEKILSPYRFWLK